MGVISAIKDTIGVLWKVDSEATNEDELTLYQKENEENRRAFSASNRTIKDLEKKLDEKPSKKKDKISPKAQVDDAVKNNTENQRENQEEREM